MATYRMSFSEDLLNHFAGSLMEGLDEIESIRFDLQDGFFDLNLHGHRYVNYAIQARYEVGRVWYTNNEQTVQFHQLGSSSIRGRFWMGQLLAYMVDEPLKDYMADLDFVTVEDSTYSFILRETETMRSFFDIELTGHKLTTLFPIDNLMVKPNELVFVANSTTKET